MPVPEVDKTGPRRASSSAACASASYQPWAWRTPSARSFAGVRVTVLTILTIIGESEVDVNGSFKIEEEVDYV